MNCPGSQNDRTAFKVSGFPKLLEALPKGYYIVGDAAYPGSDVVLVPYPGTKVSDSQDALNYYLSQCRIAIGQTFGILVSIKCQLLCSHRTGAVVVGYYFVLVHVKLRFYVWVCTG